MSLEPTIEPILSKQPKSSLNLTQQKSSTQQIQYIKQPSQHDQQQHTLSDEQRQKQISRLRQEYIMEKVNRKKQIMKIKREEFGSSSSEDDDVGAEESQDEEGPRETGDGKVKQSGNSQASQKDEEWPLNKPQKVYLLKNKQSWAQQYLIMKQNSLFLNDKQISLSSIHKIKSLPNQTPQKNQHRLKISYISQQLMLAVSRNLLFLKKQKLSLHYIIFSSIIIKKLQMMGLKFYSLQKNVPGVPESVVKNCSIYGKIFKKSQILGRWEERLVVINQMGIYSYKRFNQQHSMFIAANSVKEIWTRFQIVDQNLLVIKVLHSSNTKTQFGIPLTDFMNQRNWLYQFYNLGMK